MYSSADDSGWGFVMLCAIVGFFGSIVGIGYLIYWLFKHVAFV
jgi:NhaP-type Na+/H+ or K+/H+ antiporter